MFSSRIIFYIILWLHGIFSLYPVINTNSLVLTFPSFLIIIFSVRKIKEPSFGLKDMFWFINMIFFVLAPCQMVNNSGFVDAVAGNSYLHAYSLSEIFRAHIIIYIYLTIFGFINLKNFKRPLNILEIRHQIILVIGVISALIFLKIDGFNRIFSCRGCDLQQDTLPVNQLVNFFLLSTTQVSTYLICIRSLKRPSRISLMIVFLCLFVMCNPLRSTRFVFAVTWFPVFMIFSQKLKVFFIYCILSLGIVFLMPIFSMISRSEEGRKEVTQAFEYNPVIKDADPFATLIHYVHYQDKRDFAFGKTTLTNLFFFIPSSIWMSKEGFSNAEVRKNIETYGAGTGNLSLFVGGDFYRDFGFLGVFFGFLLVVIFRKYQKKYSIFYDNCNISDFILTSNLPILIRGSFIAVIGPFVATNLVLLLVFFFLRIIKKKRTI